MIRTAQTTGVKVRWMSGRDMRAVTEIERLCFQKPWSTSRVTRAMRHRHTIPMVAESERLGIVVGYLMFTLRWRHVELKRIAVHPEYQRCGVGMSMIAALAGKSFRRGRSRIVLRVRDDNLAAHLFFRSCGFLCTEVLHDWYGDGLDAYWFELRKT